jgi:hypothetical protein
MRTAFYLLSLLPFSISDITLSIVLSLRTFSSLMPSFKALSFTFVLHEEGTVPGNGVLAWAEFETRRDLY